MIGYILLVTVGIAMSIIVFTWIKGYVPTESIECDEGVSVFIKSYTYDCATDQFSIEIKNNGRFSISGYLIHATTEAGQELATKDLSLFSDIDGNGVIEDANGNGTIEQSESSGYVFGREIKFSSSAPAENTFLPTSEDTEWVTTHTFDLSTADFTQIYSIEIVPTRYEIISERKKLATCTKAKVKQNVVCSE